MGGQTVARARLGCPDDGRSLRSEPDLGLKENRRLERLTGERHTGEGGREGQRERAVRKRERESEKAASVASWQNLIPSFPWIAPGWRVWGRNPRKGRDQILQRSVAEP